MLERITHDNGVVTYQSPLLRAAKIPHAFSTRIGGVSQKPFYSLNLGNPSGCEQQDADPNLLENYHRLQNAIIASHMLRAWVRQVHGRTVELIDHEPENEYSETFAAEIRDRFSGQTPADALVTTTPNVLLTIRIADCVPILFASTDGKVVAAAHAGWRGVIGNIAAKTIRAMNEAGVESKNILAAIGPHISAPNFEVGQEVADEFIRQNLAHAVSRDLGIKPHINLQAALLSQLHLTGLTHIDTNTLCTFRDAGDFYSHRRDNGVTGRLAAVVGLK